MEFSYWRCCIGLSKCNGCSWPMNPEWSELTIADVWQDERPDGHPNSPAYGHLKLPHLN